MGGDPAAVLPGRGGLEMPTDKGLLPWLAHLVVTFEELKGWPDCPSPDATLCVGWG